MNKMITVKNQIVDNLIQLNKFHFNISLDNDPIYSERNDLIYKLRENYKEIKRLIIVRLDAIGDNFLFSNSIKQISKLFPSAYITYVCYAETKPIVDRCKYINTPIYIDRKLLETNKAYREKIYAKFQELKYDLLINPLYSREFLAEEIIYFINSDIKITFDGDRSNISQSLLNITNKWYDIILSTDAIKNKFELHRNAELVQLLGGESDPKQLPELWYNDDDKNFIENFISKYNLEEYAIVFPGTKGGTRSIKYWGSEKFANIADYIKDKLGLNVVILCGKDEEDISQEISIYVKSNPIILQGQFSIWQVVELVRHSKFYLGSDTSIAHFAAAQKVPTFVILGGGHFNRFFPYPDYNHVKTIYRKSDCYNCNWQCTQSTNKCIKDISVDDVKKALTTFHFEKSEELQFIKPKKRLNIIKHIGSEPKIDLLVPPSSLHSWHLKEGIINNLRINGLLNRVFYTTQEHFNHFFDYLKKDCSSDLIFAIGGDHHLYYLHDTQQKIDLWNRCKIAKICYSYESTLDSTYSFYNARALSASKVFSHFLVADENDLSFFKQNGREAIWFPQFVDTRFFVNKIKFDNRKTKVFFKGKLWNEYKQRQNVIKSLKEYNLVEIVEEYLTNSELVNKYNEFKAIINPPGVFGGFNVRTFEAMATGNLLFQFLPNGRYLNNSLFKHNEHLIYFDPNNISQLIKILQDFQKRPELFEQIAKNGFNETVENHSLEKRMCTLLNWVQFNTLPEYPTYQSTDKKLKTKKLDFNDQNKIIVNNQIKVSAIVSVYNSERFIDGCLSNLVSQTLFKKDELEIIIVNTGSEQDEERIIFNYLNKYKNIKYIKTSERETIYSAWDRGILQANGKYLTNANTDDRYKYNALEVLSNALDANDQIDVVYADQFVTVVPNDTWDSNTEKKLQHRADFDKDLLLFGCFIGSQPMWRKSLHAKHGYFNKELKVVGDYEFWLRISQQAKFQHLAKPLGLYFYSDQSAEHRDKNLTNDENIFVKKQYLSLYLKNENHINRINDKLDLLASNAKSDNYFVQAGKLLKMRKNGIAVEQEINDFLSKVSNFKDEELLNQASNYLKKISDDNLILNYTQYFEILNSIIASYYSSLSLYNEARKCYEEILQVDNNSAIACEGLGNIFLIEGNIEAAKVMFEWTVKNNPGYQNAQNKLAEINRLLSLPEKHNSLFEKDEIKVEVQS